MGVRDHRYKAQDRHKHKSSRVAKHAKRSRKAGQKSNAQALNGSFRGSAKNEGKRVAASKLITDIAYDKAQSGQNRVNTLFDTVIGLNKDSVSYLIVSQCLNHIASLVQEAEVEIEIKPRQLKKVLGLWEKVTKHNAPGARELASIIWAAGALGIKDENFWALAKEQIVKQANLMMPIDLSNIAWGMCRTENYDPAVFQYVEARAIELIQNSKTEGVSIEFSPQSISNLAWACAGVEHYSENLFDMLKDKASELVGSFDFQHTANTAWAFSKAGFYDEEFFEILGSRALLTYGRRDQVNISQMFVAYSNVGYPNEEFFLSLAEIALEYKTGFDAQSIGCIAYSLGKIGLKHTALLEALSKQAQELVDDLEPLWIADILFACGNLGFRDLKLIDCLVEKALKIIDSFDHRSISIAVHGCALMEYQDNKFFDKLCERAIGIKESFNGTSLSLFIGSLSVLRYYNHEFVREISDLIERDLDQYTFKAMASIAACYTRWDLEDPDLYERICERMLKIIDEGKETVELKSVAHAVWAFSLDNEYLIPKLLEKVTYDLNEMNPSESIAEIHQLYVAEIVGELRKVEDCPKCFSQTWERYEKFEPNQYEKSVGVVLADLKNRFPQLEIEFGRMIGGIVTGYLVYNLDTGKKYVVECDTIEYHCLSDGRVRGHDWIQDKVFKLAGCKPVHIWDDEWKQCEPDELGIYVAELLELDL